MRGFIKAILSFLFGEIEECEDVLIVGKDVDWSGEPVEMLVKLGVDISRLKRPIRRVLPIVDRVYREHGEEAVITSTYEGDHSPGSLHYADLAIDIRYAKDNPTGVAMELVQEIRDKLGDDYDIVLEKDHIHIEYDPKGR